jgi:anti-sigma regulatory factor (Ser/Thr protein kinase)
MSRVGSPGLVSDAHVEALMVARPSSVPAVRRFVRRALTDWGCAGLVDDVGLCASELVTNATLHSGTTYIQVDLDRSSSCVRLAVADAGAGSVDVLARQPELSDALFDDLDADDAATTGRGMFLVSALAVAWGIDELPRGKRIWAEFGARSSGLAAGTSDAVVSHDPGRPAPALDPDDWAVVRFLDCPPGLLLAHDDNLAAYTRELYLIGSRLGEPSFERLASVLDSYRVEHAANWDPARIAAHEAVRAGLEAVDIEIVATRDIRAAIDFLRSLIGEAETLSAEGKLMTMPAPPPVQDLRDWFEVEFIEQIEEGRDPVSYTDWLARKD